MGDDHAGVTRTLAASTEELQVSEEEDWAEENSGVFLLC